MPSTATSPPLQWAFISSTTSPRRAMRTPGRSIVTPSPSYSAATQPAPSPTSRRPSESMSSVASSLASTTGWWRSTLKHAAADAQVGRRRGGRGHRRDRGHVDRSVARRLGDRAGAEVVVGREQRAVAEVLGPAGDRRSTPCRTWPRRPGRRSGTGAVRQQPWNPRSRPASVSTAAPYSTTIPVTSARSTALGERSDRLEKGVLDDGHRRRRDPPLDDRRPRERPVRGRPRRARTSTCAGSAPTRRSAR